MGEQEQGKQRVHGSSYGTAGKNDVLHEFLSIEQAAALLGVHERTVRRAIREGEIPAVKIGRMWRIQRQEMIEALRARGQAALADDDLGED